MKTLTAALLTLGLVISACGGGDSDEAAPDSTSSSTSTSTTTTTTSTTAPKPMRLTEQDLLDALNQSELPIGETVVYDAETDPNELLGRPGQYSGKAGWTDTRVECFGTEPGWDCGGDVEAFDDDDTLVQRFTYLSGFADQPPVGGFYLWHLPGLIVRVGFALTPDQAVEYGAVLESIAPGDVVQYEG